MVMQEMTQHAKYLLLFQKKYPKCEFTKFKWLSCEIWFKAKRDVEKILERSFVCIISFNKKHINKRDHLTSSNKNAIINFKISVTQILHLPCVMNNS